MAENESPSRLGHGLMQLRNGDIELRFNMRNGISELLSESVNEHGVLVPPIILKLNQQLKVKFRTSKEYICIDGHSRLLELPQNAMIDCQVIEWDKLLMDSSLVLERLNIDVSKLDEDAIVRSYILRLHACREPLPKEAYVRQAEKLNAKGLNIRQIATLLGVPKSTLHDWMRKIPLDDQDIKGGDRSTKRQCGYCGRWIHQGARPIWFHPECHDKVTILLEKAKGGEDENE